MIKKLNILILAIFAAMLPQEVAAAGGGGGGGGGGCAGGTSISCGVTINSSTGSCIGCDPTNNNNSIGQCCYIGSDLDCDGAADVSYSVENTRSFTYTVPAGASCPTTYNFTFNTTANLQGVVFNTTYNAGGGFDGGHGTSDEHGSGVMGSGTFTLTTTGCPGDVLQIFIDGYAGATGTFSFSVPCPVILPIELVSFTAIRRREEEVIFQWITASETNNDFFTIEESSDGETFIPVGTVKGAGTINTKQEYEMIHKSSSSIKNVYYRLRQTDFNGDTTVSDVILVQDKEITEITHIDPMPVKDIATLNMYSAFDQLSDIRIYDITGRLVYASPIEIKAGENSYQLDLSGLEKGSYVISAGNAPLSKNRIFKD